MPTMIQVGDLFAVVDDEDAEMVMAYTWRKLKCDRNGTVQYYARGSKIGGPRNCVLMHRLIMGFPDGNIDHKNGDKLDNQKHNLRVATVSQNMANSRKKRNASSRFKGVTWCKTTLQWRCRIGFDGETINLGRFDSDEAAAEAYDRAAIELFGEFSNTNFPKERYIVHR